MHSAPYYTSGSRTDHRIARWVEPAMRAGYAAKGIVYLILGGLAVRAALAAGGGATDARGALRWLEDSTFGSVALIGVAIGLAGFVLWRLVQAVRDPEHPEGGAKRAFARAGYLASAVVYGSLAWSAWLLWQTGRDSGRDESFWVAQLMAQPFGRLLAFAVGAFVLGYGVYQFARGFSDRLAKRLVVRDAVVRDKLVKIGRFGTAARGVVLALVGWIVIDAARRYDPSAAGGTDEALRMLGHGWLFALVALGLVAYGIYQLAQARWRAIEA